MKTNEYVWSFLLLLLLFPVAILAHELGHYAVAEYYDLDPEIHTGKVFLDGSIKNSIAVTTYHLHPDRTINILINGAGVFMNLSIALLSFLAARKLKKDDMFFNFLLLLAISNFVLAIVSLIPTHGSDGLKLLALLR